MEHDNAIKGEHVRSGGNEQEKGKNQERGKDRDNVGFDWKFIKPAKRRKLSNN
jgi:hypothetical protein